MAVAYRTSLTLSNTKHSKSYSVALESVKGGFVVNFEYGAIGQVQRSGTKTPTPVPHEKAVKIYDKLVAEKTGKPCECCGAVYTSSSDSAPAAVTVPASVPDSVSRFVPELLEPITHQEANSLLLDDEFVLEEKFDGQRVSIYFEGDYPEQEAATLKLIAFNKLGKTIPVPGEVARILRTLPYRKLWLDGEFVGGRYIVFDVLAYVGLRGQGFTELSDLRYEIRRRYVWDFICVVGDVPDNLKHIGVSKEHRGELAKKTALTDLKARGVEGVVFKNVNQPYMPGRQGISRKLKFWESATVRVCAKTKDSGAHSFGVEVWTGFERAERDKRELYLDWESVGNVTCKGPLPAIGTYREVKYLYVGVGGRLYQPEDFGARTDVTDADCGFLQLKHKAVA